MAKANKPMNVPKIKDDFPNELININLKGLEVIKSFAKTRTYNYTSVSDYLSFRIIYDMIWSLGGYISGPSVMSISSHQHFLKFGSS